MTIKLRRDIKQDVLDDEIKIKNILSKETIFKHLDERKLLKIISHKWFIQVGLPSDEISIRLEIAELIIAS